MPGSFQADTASHDPAAYLQLFRYAEDIQVLLEQKKQMELRKPNRAASQIDGVTGLPTWTPLAEQADRTLAVAHLLGATLLLLVLNISGLRKINNTLGRETGDRVLRHIADNLRHAIPENDLLARLEGDEFVIVSHMSASQAEKSITRALSAPLVVDGHEIRIGLSIGGARLAKDSPDFSTLFRKANIALGFARSYKLNYICLYSDPMETQYSRESMTIDADIWHAMQRDELYLNYQPRVATQEPHHLEGAEALLRWKHPVLGNIAPSKFIPAAERNGALIPIGAWVLRKSCEQLRVWSAQGLEDMTMAVNVSPQQLRSSTFLDTLTGVLRETGISPASLELEITESEIMSSHDLAKDILTRIRQLDVRIAIDDFGTGHSSLSRLKDLPISRLKIDRSLICDIETETRAQAVISCIMDLSTALDIDVVAEGVERSGQLEKLKEYGCHYVQGFFFGQPMLPEIFYHWAFPK